MQFGDHIALHRDIMGSAFAPTELDMPFCAQESKASFAQSLDCQCLHNQPENRLAFDASWLNVEPLCGNDIAYTSVLGFCDNICRPIFVSSSASSGRAA